MADLGPLHTYHKQNNTSIETTGQLTSSSTTRRFPFEQAKCNGVNMLSSVAFTSAPHDIKYCRIDASALREKTFIGKFF